MGPPPPRPPQEYRHNMIPQPVNVWGLRRPGPSKNISTICFQNQSKPVILLMHFIWNNENLETTTIAFKKEIVSFRLARTVFFFGNHINYVLKRNHFVGRVSN